MDGTEDDILWQHEEVNAAEDSDKDDASDNDS